MVDGMHTLGKTVEFASQWNGRNRYSWSSETHILSEFESVHGGPRIGEPGCGELISVEEFCKKVVDDHGEHHNTFQAKTKSWFGDVP